jgi:hypothetical protein
MNNLISKLVEGQKLYNSNYEYIGFVGKKEHNIYVDDEKLLFIKLDDNPKFGWVYGKLTRSHYRGFILDDIVYKHLG